MNSFDDSATRYPAWQPKDGTPVQPRQQPGSTGTPAGGVNAAPAPATAPPRPPAPGWLLGARRWLLWREEPNPDPTKKPKKVPYYVGGGRREGTLDTPEDVAKLVSITEASEAFLKLKPAYAGLGFALGPDGAGCWQGIDLDGVLDKGLSVLAEALPGYVETSPSQSGVHAIGYGEAFDTLGSNNSGIEAYSKGRFFTWTGRSVDPDAPLVDLSTFVRHRLVPIHSSKRAPGQAGSGASLGGADSGGTEYLTPQQVTELRSALNFIPAHDRAVWIEVGMALKGLGEVGRELWYTWSQTCPEQWDPQDAAYRWRTFDPHSISYRSIFTKAQERGWVNPASKAAQIAEPAPTAEQVSQARAEPAAPAFGLSNFEPPRMNLTHMLADLVFIADGELVAFRSNPKLCTSAKAMRTLLLSNKTLVKAEEGEDGKKDKEFKTFDLWLASPLRETVFGLTFDPSAERMFEDAKGVRHLNLWCEPVHPAAPANVLAWIEPVLEHLQQLLPVEAERELFIDFLAHMAQRPGELPSFAWLFVAELQGSGRGLLFKLLDRVWPGYFARGLDMVDVLTDKFNDEVSCKLGLEVSEVNEGVQRDMFKLNEKIKSFTDSPVRNMNPKYGRKRTEKNCGRLFLCSNHITAIPLTKDDRRIVVVRCSAPKDAAYYKWVGDAFQHPVLVASFWHYLRQRDISEFNPFQHAPTNDIKRELLETAKSHADRNAEETVTSWPAEVITSRQLLAEVYGDDKDRGAKEGSLEHVARRAGISKWRGTSKGGRVRLWGKHSSQETVWILRNHEHWAAAPVEALKAELRKSSPN